MTSQSDIGETVRAALQDRQDLVAVYLFGSAARDQAHTLSDVDVAVLFRHNARLVSRVSKEGLGRGYHGHRNALEEARRLSARLAADANRPPERVPGR